MICPADLLITVRLVDFFCWFSVDWANTVANVDVIAWIVFIRWDDEGSGSTSQFKAAETWDYSIGSGTELWQEYCRHRKYQNQPSPSILVFVCHWFLLHRIESNGLWSIHLWMSFDFYEMAWSSKKEHHGYPVRNLRPRRRHFRHWIRSFATLHPRLRWPHVKKQRQTRDVEENDVWFDLTRIRRWDGRIRWMR